MLLDAFSMQHWQEAIELTESTLESMTKLTVESSAGADRQIGKKGCHETISIKFVDKAAALH